MKKTTLILATAVSCCLGGCATNAIRLDRAATMSAAGTNAIDSTRLFLNQVKQARDEANIAMIASDESCAWGEYIVLRGDGRPVPPNATTGPFCLKRGEPANEALGDVKINLSSVSDTAIKPTLQSIDALAAYIDAVNEILAEDAPDVSGKLADAYQKALTAQGDLAAIFDSDIAVIPTLKDDQTAAITGLISLIEKLAFEQRKVKELRALARDQDAQVQKVIALLRSSIEKWGQSSLAGDLQLSDAAYVSIGRRLAADPPIYKGFDDRREVLVRIVQSKRNAKASNKVAAAVDTTLLKLSDAQQSFFDGFTRNPNWTKEERRKAAKLNRERVLAALHSLAAVVKAF